MAENYAVRAEQRILAHHTCLYIARASAGKGIAGFLSASGWRATEDHQITQGMVMPVYIEPAPDGQASRYGLIESAIARWPSGQDAGREIHTIDATSRARLKQFLDQFREELSPDLPMAGS